MSSVTFRGLAGQSAFRVPFIADSASDFAVTVGGVTAPFTFANDVVTVSTPLAVEADVVITFSGLKVVSGSLSATGDTSSTPFTAEPYKPINVHLSGTWAGTVALKRRLPGETGYSGLTVAGSDWAVYTSNVNEQAWEENERQAQFIIDFSRTSGTLVYRISQ